MKAIAKLRDWTGVVVVIIGVILMAPGFLIVMIGVAMSDGTDAFRAKRRKV